MSDTKDSLGDRMKRYENVTRGYLSPRTPTIIRLDGKAFHTYTRGFPKPFFDVLADCMIFTCERLVNNIQNAEIVYTQSDEISILLNDWKNLETQQWFEGNIQKISSVSASMCTAYFNSAARGNRLLGDYTLSLALFDSRVFQLPKEEVVNYFIWRQQDCVRNSISSLAQSLYSQKELDGVKSEGLIEMCKAKDRPWELLPVRYRMGTVVTRNEWHINKTPNFIHEREFISQFLEKQV